MQQVWKSHKFGFMASLNLEDLAKWAPTWQHLSRADQLLSPLDACVLSFATVPTISY